MRELSEKLTNKTLKMKDYSKLSKEKLIDELILLGDENLILTSLNEKQTEQLDLYGVVRSFLVKEAESLGIEVNDLYLHMFDNKLYLEKADTESYYFELIDVREVE